MIAKRQLKDSTNDVIKIILYMVCITTLFILYCNNTNNEIVNSIDYYQPYYNNNDEVAVISQLENGKSCIPRHTYCPAISNR